MREVSPGADGHRARRHRQSDISNDLKKSERQPTSGRISSDNDLGWRNSFVLRAFGRVEKVEIYGRTGQLVAPLVKQGGEARDLTGSDAVLKSAWERVLWCFSVVDGEGSTLHLPCVAPDRVPVGVDWVEASDS